MRFWRPERPLKGWGWNEEGDHGPVELRVSRMRDRNRDASRGYEWRRAMHRLRDRFGSGGDERRMRRQRAALLVDNRAELRATLQRVLRQAGLALLQVRDGDE